MFEELRINDFRLFKDVDIRFGRFITVLAGRNSTGKSTVLGLVANAGELKGYKSLFGTPFRAEFSELFRGSEKHDNPGSHRLMLKAGLSGGEVEVDFRTTWQSYKDGTRRFRIIPRRDGEGGKATESKLPYPVLYLGLSRLYPVGESQYGAEKAEKTHWDNEEDKEWFVESYRSILSQKSSVLDVKSVSLRGISHKHGLGVETESYDSLANSAGQDNVGQILLALLSFRRLKRQMGSEYPGGILLIDEFDATLHPYAQEKLFSLMKEECRKQGFQIVLTTHSVSLLEFVCSLPAYGQTDRTAGVELYYFSNALGKLKVLHNPTFFQVRADLTLASPVAGSRKVGVFTEDEEARHLLSKLIQGSSLEGALELVECSFGANQLVHLFVHDFAYLRDRIVVFDGDVSRETLGKIPKPLRDAGGNIVLLPGGKRPEEVVYDFLCSFEDEQFWMHAFTMGFSKDALVARGPFSDEYKGGGSERVRFKRWYRDYESLLESIGAFDAFTEANRDMVDSFLSELLASYNTVAARTMARQLAAPGRGGV